MAQFHTLTVTDVAKTTRDAVVVSLQPDRPEAFDFTQGQYLTFRRDFDGVELRRSYSICTAPGQGLQVGIKRVDGGAFSTWANTDLAPGAVVEAMPPMGNFYAAPGAGHVLAFAGGSGITPVLSILRAGLLTDPDTRFTLVYANRNANSVMFRDEISDLKDQHLGRLTVIHILEDEAQEIDLFRGRIDGAKCAALFEQWIDLPSVSTAFICGPEPMMLAISEALTRHGLPKDRIRFELFASGQPGRAAQPAPSALRDEGTEARVVLNGEAREFTLPPGTTLLQGALDNALDAPFACRAGVCSTCKAKVLEGEVEMVANHALEDYEVDQGFVLTCQCHPLSDRVVVDYDQAGH